MQFQDSVKMNELFTFLFDEDILKNKLREKWIKLYDFNYIYEKVIGGLLTTKKNIADLLEFVYNKATGGINNIQLLEASKTKTLLSKSLSQPSIEKSATKAGSDFNNLVASESFRKSDELTELNKEGNKDGNVIPRNNIQTKLTKSKVTIPEPFNLSENRPRIFKEPIKIENHIKITEFDREKFKKADSLQEIENKRKQRLEITKKNIIEKHNKERAFDFETEKRPTNFEKIKEEVKNKENSELQFNNKYCNPPKDFSKDNADIKYNEAAILREEYLILKV